MRYGRDSGARVDGGGCSSVDSCFDTHAELDAGMQNASILAEPLLEGFELRCPFHAVVRAYSLGRVEDMGNGCRASEER